MTLAPCGCVREVTEEHDVVTALCAGHWANKDQMDAGIRAASDAELDYFVGQLGRGKRCERIWKPA